MFFTRVLSAKSSHVRVVCESLVTGHRVNAIRERKADKLEVVMFDPYVRKKVVYKEIKKLTGVDVKNFKPLDTLESLDG
ncbi:large ribosomal subunit protein bL33m [Planococcus citri]|uniref:large ribosomal subunit protein bL33m n=1 Tax=Planococcus citri TaxID=170843 RepID=UPI0031F92276